MVIMSESVILKKNIAFNVLRTLLNVAYPIITFSYTARILTVNDMGSVTFARNYVSYFSLLATLGVNYYGIREGARLKEDKCCFSKLFWEINSINVIASVVAIALFFFSIVISDKLAGYGTLLLVASIGIYLSAFSNEWVLSACEEYKYLTVRTLFIQIVCMLLIVFTIRTGEDYVKYCAILQFSSFGSSIFNWIFIARSKIVLWIPLRELKIKRHLQPIFVLFAMLISIDLYTLLDTTMLGFIKGEYSVGIYNAAIKIPRLVNSVIASVGAVLVPRLSYYYDIDRLHFQCLINKAHDFIIFITVPAFLGIITMADEIVAVFAGNQYGDAVLTARLLSLLTLIIPISVLFNNQIFIPMRKEILVLKSTGIGAMVNLLMNLLLIPRFSQNGAAVASVVAEFSVMLVCLYHVNKELVIQVVWKKYMRAFLTSLNIVIGAILVKHFIKNVYLCLFATVVICAAIYVSLNVKIIKQLIHI